ncbi:MAG: glycosyl transferase [Clostridia bacterium]|nr:glycosyl transferase [Clostridia bacterium]
MKNVAMVKYGYFDAESREYVITRPDTPTPWINYLGENGFSGIISNTAGGLSFDGDPSYRRVTRYKFNNLPVDRPGRYVYILDKETGDYWNPMWQPVMKDLDFYECRHGLGYTVITGERRGVRASVRYSVPVGQRYELWDGKATNISGKEKKLRLFSYVEWSWFDAERDILCDWPRMIFRCRRNGRRIEFDPVSEQCPSGLMRSFIATDLDVIGHDCSLARFIGKYRSESNPAALERGACFGTDVLSDNAVGVLCSEITLAPGETKTFRYVLGCCDDFGEADGIIPRALDGTLVEKQKKELFEKWDGYLSSQKVETPDGDVNVMLNCWHAYQARLTYSWSRFISLYERGIDRGFGFRDSMQDVLGIMHADPAGAKSRIRQLLSIQYRSGEARTVFYPATGVSKGGGRSDDHLWSVFSVCQYIRETGDFSFLDESVPFADGGEGPVAEHLEASLSFTMDHLGRHGLPDFRLCDWNDSMTPINQRGGAESTFVFFQLAHAAKELSQVMAASGREGGHGYAGEVYSYCRSKLGVIWDGKWFIRAFTSEGEPYGTDSDEEDKIFLNPQSWAVLSGLPDKKDLNTAFDEVMKRLFTEWGLATHSPASDGYDLDRKRFFPFASGSRENGGIFYHSNTWAIIALAMLGRNGDVWKCYRACLPPRRNEKADLCRTEPYVYTQTMIGPTHPDFGKCSNSWLTGTASWMYLAATQYILGVRPDYDGLRLDPCVPREWDGFSVSRVCRGKKLNFRFTAGSENDITVNGMTISGKVVPWGVIASLGDGAEIHVTYERPAP